MLLVVRAPLTHNKISDSTNFQKVDCVINSLGSVVAFSYVEERGYFDAKCKESRNKFEWDYFIVTVSIDHRERTILTTTMYIENALPNAKTLTQCSAARVTIKPPALHCQTHDEVKKQ